MQVSKMLYKKKDTWNSTRRSLHNINFKRI